MVRSSKSNNIVVTMIEFDYGIFALLKQQLERPEDSGLYAEY